MSNTNLSVVVTQAQRDWIDKRATCNDMSRSQAVRALLRDLMAREEQAEEAVENGHRNGTWRLDIPTGYGTAE